MKNEQTQIVKNYSGAIVQTQRTYSKISSSFKGKGLRGDSPEFAVNFEGISEESENGAVAGYVKVSHDLYLKENWFYGVVANTFLVEDGKYKTAEEKSKLNVGPVNFKLVPVFDFIASFMDENVEFELMGEEELNAMFSVASNVEARELFGKLTVEVKFDIKSIMLVLLSIFGVNPDEMTEEERIEFEAELEAALEKAEDTIIVDKASITFVIAKEGYVEKMSTHVDITMKNYDEEVEPKVLTSTEQNKIESEFTMALNKKVNIKYPDFSDYKEITL